MYSNGRQIGFECAVLYRLIRYSIGIPGIMPGMPCRKFCQAIALPTVGNAMLATVANIQVPDNLFDIHQKP